MTTPKMLTSTGPMWRRPLSWALGVIAEAGYDGAEIMVTPSKETQDPNAIAAAAATEGIAPLAVHGPFLLVTRTVFGTANVPKAERSLQLAADVGATTMIVHPPFRWDRAFHDWLLGEGNHLASQLGTTIGVENLYPVKLSKRHVRLHRYTAPRHLTPFPHVVFDTSHFGVAGEDLLAAWALLSTVTTHIHLSDNRGLGRDSHAPLGHGVLPLASFLHQVGKDVEANGWDMTITMELDCRRYLDDRAALVGYLDQERRKCLALLGGASAPEVLGREDRVLTAPDGGEDDFHQPTAG